MENDNLFLFIAGTINKGQELITKYIISGIARSVNVVVVDAFKGKKLESLLAGENVSFVKYEGMEFDDWEQVEAYNRKFISDNKIKNFIFIKHLMQNGIRNGDESTLRSFFKRYKSHTKMGMNYQSIKKALCFSLLIKNVIDSGAKTMSFMIDPLEPDYNNVISGNNVKNLFIAVRPGLVYMPCYEMVLFEDAMKEDTHKQIDFAFYCTCFSSNREWMLKYKNTYDCTPGFDVHIIGRKDRNTECVSQHEYYKILSTSKFTMCIPPYDKTSFSIIRFFEAVCRDCLCLVLNSCNLDEVLFTFPDIYGIIIKRGLVVDGFEVLPQKIQELSPHREEVISEIKNTKSFRKIMNPDVVKARWSKLLRNIEGR